METTQSEEILSWAEIVAIEPQVELIVAAARSITYDPEAEYSCGPREFHEPGGFKDQLSEYVGWRACEPRLRTERAYDIVYDKVRRALPDCRNQ
jgi:hypothetical protein